jgi:hypothetical protein
MADIAQCPPTHGWVTQQILKVMIARNVKSERYVVLDSKNHFVFPLTRDFLEDKNDRASMMFYSYYSNPLLNYLEMTLEYFGLDRAYINNFTQSTTPFIFFTDIVCQMINDVSRENGVSFENIFVNNQLTEFFCYTSYMIKHGIDLSMLYFDNQLGWPTVWERGPLGPGEGAVTAQITNATSKEIPIFGISRRAIVKFDQKTMRRIAEFWYHCNLFDSPSAAHRFLIQWHRRHIYYKYIDRFLTSTRASRRIVRMLRETRFHVPGRRFGNGEPNVPSRR